MSERGEFCRVHAFYDCPVCRGEEVVWVIPIVDGSDPMGHGGNVVGVIEIPEQFDDQLAHYEIGWEGRGVPEPPMPVSLPLLFGEDETPPPADLLETVKQIFSWQNEPRHREAAARGRKVHTDAIALIEEDPSYDYQEAIEEILRRRDEA